MSLEENKAIIRRYTEACNKKNLALLDELVAPDYFHSALQMRGREEYARARVATARSAREILRFLRH